MRVLMISRATLFSSVGGDTVQILNTSKYLRELGVEVDVRTTNDTIDYHSYDLIHFFNIIRPADILAHIQKCNLPFVVSTIFVDYSEYEKQNRKGLPGVAFRFLSNDRIEYIKSIARHIKNGEKIRSRYYFIRGYKRSVEFVASRASYLLPNSESEYSRFANAYAAKSNYVVVPNAVDKNLFAPDASKKQDKNVITVGRIEGRKNQLNVIRAINDTDLSLSVVGNSSPNHYKYFRLCKEEAERSGRISFISHISQEELIPVYKEAKVHVLASWFETTGLSTMEAALLGCNIVITDKGDTKEYFRDYAFYCDPGNVNSIREAIEKAYASPYSEELRKLILENYTWEIAARNTLDAYNKTLMNASIKIH